jgi:hypothetical protein
MAPLVLSEAISAKNLHQDNKKICWKRTSSPENQGHNSGHLENGATKGLQGQDPIPRFSYQQTSKLGLECSKLGLETWTRRHKQWGTHCLCLYSPPSPACGEHFEDSDLANTVPCDTPALTSSGSQALLRFPRPAWKWWQRRTLKGLRVIAKHRSRMSRRSNTDLATDQVTVFMLMFLRTDRTQEIVSFQGRIPKEYDSYSQPKE